MMTARYASRLRARAMGLSVQPRSTCRTRHAPSTWGGKPHTRCPAVSLPVYRNFAAPWPGP